MLQDDYRDERSRSLLEALSFRIDRAIDELSFERKTRYDRQRPDLRSRS